MNNNVPPNRVTSKNSFRLNMTRSAFFFQFHRPSALRCIEVLITILITIQYVLIIAMSKQIQLLILVLIKNKIIVLTFSYLLQWQIFEWQFQLRAPDQVS